MTTLAKRIALLRGNTPQAKFAATFGVAQNTIGRYERGENTPDAHFLLALRQKLGVSAEWLLTGEGPVYDPARTKIVNSTVESGCDEPLSKVIVTNPESQCDVDLMFVPMVEARMSAGTGSFETDTGSERLYAFRSEFLSRKGQPSQMVLMRVSGNSMEPEIRNEDVVLIDKSQAEPRPGKMYAVRVGELIYLKVVDSLPEGLVLKSINPAYEPLKIDMRGDLADGVRILGKVIWWCREAR
jgi:phage repressor protein C with HTH and peptisase S24 domain